MTIQAGTQNEVSLVNEYPTTVLSTEINKPSTEAPKEKSFALRMAFADYNYTEPTVMKIDGMMAGIVFNSRYEPHFVQSVWGFNGEFFVGKNKYDGGIRYTDNSVEPYQTDSDDYFYNLQGYWGHKIALDRSASTVEFRLGLGYWSLHNLLRSEYGYEREQVYYYLPVMLGWRKIMNQDWTLSANAEYDFLLEGRNRTHSVGGNGPVTIYNQRSGHGGRLALHVAKQLGSNIYSAELSHRFWIIAKSDVVHSEFEDEFGQWWTRQSWEPENETAMTGLSFGIIY